MVGFLISGIGAFWASQQQTSSALNLLTKSEEIARLNQELANSVSGGDSFCYLAISTIHPVTNTGQLYVIHSGEHNLYGVRARIVDVEKLHQLFYGKIPLDQAEMNISIGDLIPSFAQRLSPFTLDNGNTRSFNVLFTARNGSFKQLLWFKKIHGEWLYATKVERGSKVLFEQVPKEFPRTAMGNVEWGRVRHTGYGQRRVGRRFAGQCVGIRARGLSFPISPYRGRRAGSALKLSCGPRSSGSSFVVNAWV